MDKYNLYHSLSYEMNVRKINDQLNGFCCLNSICGECQHESYVRDYILYMREQLNRFSIFQTRSLLEMGGFRTLLQMYIMTKGMEQRHRIHCALKGFDLCDLILKNPEKEMNRDNIKEVFFCCSSIKWEQKIISLYQTFEQGKISEEQKEILIGVKKCCAITIVMTDIFMKFTEDVNQHAKVIKKLVQLMYFHQRQLWSQGIKREIMYQSNRKQEE